MKDRIRCAGRDCSNERRFTRRDPAEVAAEFDWWPLADGRFLCRGCASVRNLRKPAKELPSEEQARYDRIMAERQRFNAEVLEAHAEGHEASRPEFQRRRREGQGPVSMLRLKEVRPMP